MKVEEKIKEPKKQFKKELGLVLDRILAGDTLAESFEKSVIFSARETLADTGRRLPWRTGWLFPGA